MPISQISANMLGVTQLGLTSVNLGVPIIENPTTVSYSYAITTGTNAQSAGPITVADGVVVTVSDGSVWTIV
jgi:hypothetical protein